MSSRTNGRQLVIRYRWKKKRCVGWCRNVRSIGRAGSAGNAGGGKAERQRPEPTVNVVKVKKCSAVAREVEPSKVCKCRRRALLF